MIGLIVAYAKNRVIGKDGIIPWNIPGEQTRFRELTTGNIIIMGRRSYEEIGFPLPNRITIVISSSKEFKRVNAGKENLYIVSNLEEGLELARKIDSRKNVYISGGEQVYKESLPYVEIMYITEIDLDIEGDRFFPVINEDEWEIILEDKIDSKTSYKYFTYKRK